MVVIVRRSRFLEEETPAERVLELATDLELLIALVLVIALVSEIDQAVATDLAPEIVFPIAQATAVMEIGRATAIASRTVPAATAPTLGTATITTSTLAIRSRSIVTRISTTFATSGTTSTSIVLATDIGGMVDVTRTIPTGVGTPAGIAIRHTGAGDRLPGVRLVDGSFGMRGRNR
ncbi:hypothetical protein GCM10023155_32570 [Bremerella cremea]